MAEILLEPSSRSKIIPLSFDLNDTSASNAAQLMTKRQFNTADTDAWFQISLDDFVDTAGSFDITLFNLNDKSVFNHTGKPFTTNPFYYKLDSGSDETTNEIRHAGRWIGQIVVTLANGDSATRKFIFDIEGHILDGADVQTILLEDYNALIATINTLKDLLTQYNVDYAALLVDVTTAEGVREQAEIDRAAVFATLVESEMVAPTLLSGWVNYGDHWAAAGYYKGPDNRVHLQGLIKSGTVAGGTVIFTLPQGFRPKQKQMFIIFISGGGYGRVDVNESGSVVANTVNATYTSLSGISFLAEN